MALRSHANIDVVRLLVESYPDSVAFRETFTGSLPLHLACRYGRSAEIVRFFLEKDLGAARSLDSYGYIPLHRACCGDAPPDLFNLLIA
jgi:ankyrin repeat protein